jgi:hypothetical protein
MHAILRAEEDYKVDYTDGKESVGNSRDPVTGRFVKMFVATNNDGPDLDWVEETLGGLYTDDEDDGLGFGVENQTPESLFLEVEDDEDEYPDRCVVVEDRYSAMAKAAEVETASVVKQAEVATQSEPDNVEDDCDDGDKFVDRPIVLPGKFKKGKSFSKPDTEERRRHKKLVSRMRRQRRESDPSHAWLDQTVESTDNPDLETDQVMVEGRPFLELAELELATVASVKLFGDSTDAFIAVVEFDLKDLLAA